MSTIVNSVTTQQQLMGKLDHDVDLLDGLTAICRENHITLGRVSAIGAVKSATVAYYNQQSRRYEEIRFDKNLEIISLIGNVSLKDGEPLVHAHVTFSDPEGGCLGGHLATGTPVFACEYTIVALDGPALVRGYDEQTGLPLWR